MATTEISQFPAATESDQVAPAGMFKAVVLAFLQGLASLRLTVTLFALSMVLVLAGTLAQIDHDIWYVIDNYFRTFFARVPIGVFFPRAWNVTLPFDLIIPGGWLLGGALGLNLLAAHAMRFKVTARGTKLAWGLALLVVGGAIVWAVIRSGLDDTIESELSSQFCNNLWHALRAALGGAALAISYLLALSYGQSRKSASRWAWWLGAMIAAGLLILAIWLFMNPQAQLNPSGLRIMWQLIKATAASVVLWAGCAVTFGKRAGIVLLHGGIALMMFSELYTGLTAVESQMRLFKDEPLSYAQDFRNSELVLIDKSDGKVDKVVSIPGSMVQEAAATQTPIQHAGLPFAVHVHQFMPNATVRLLQPGEASEATAGVGQVYGAFETPGATGVAKNQAFDVPAALVELISEGGTSSGVLMLAPFPGADAVRMDGKTYEAALQFKRHDKPYTLTLLKFEHEKYEGTETAKSFKSYLRLQDEEVGEDREAVVWMNNPLRYRGDTLYQSGFDPDNQDYTELQVVSNQGWMIPYVACMIVATGMLAHFGAMLIRFVRRREEEAARVARQHEVVDQRLSLRERFTQPRYWAPAALTLVFALWVVGRARPKSTPAVEMQISKFAELPVAYGGRVQPFDSLARNTLRQISDSEVLRLAEEKDSWIGRTFGVKKKIPAHQWLLDTVARRTGWQDYRAFRVQDLDLLQLLGLERRSGFRYSFADLLGNAEQFDRQVRLAQEAAQAAEEGGRELQRVQQSILELRQKTDRVLMLIDAFSTAEIDVSSREALQASTEAVRRRLDFLQRIQAPRVIPPAEPEGKWTTALEADFNDFVGNILNPDRHKSNEAGPLLQKVLAARSADQVAQFNARLEEYAELIGKRAADEQIFEAGLKVEQGEVGRKPAERLSLGRLHFEAWFNQFSPFVLCIALYISAFVLATLALMGWSEGFNRSANWLLWLTFGLHTVALICRIYISGRPPVTNLYSSAVFIGWAAVLFALLFEIIYRMGLGNLLAAAIGFPTMLIAYFLAGDSDTFAVLQAVLDTQFWLATHVVCITLGYATTFLAGALGLLYLLVVRLGGQLSQDQRRHLIRMTYGTVCFSIFFSFVGTVLGGLWADDSWGRFWGWDPKENGALLIVVWNAIVLHARWGKMIGDRGLAVLAVFGNIVVAWSWFGVNQLEVGLHSYGRTSGVTLALVIFAVSQLAVMATAWLPDRTQSGVHAGTS